MTPVRLCSVRLSWRLRARPSATLHEIRPALRRMEYLVCNTGCRLLQIHRYLVWRFGHDRAHSVGEGRRVELGSDNLVRAVGEVGDAPVADERDELLGLRGLDLRAEMSRRLPCRSSPSTSIRTRSYWRAQNIDSAFLVRERRIDVKALEARGRDRAEGESSRGCRCEEWRALMVSCTESPVALIGRLTLSRTSSAVVRVLSCCHPVQRLSTS